MAKSNCILKAFLTFFLLLPLWIAADTDRPISVLIIGAGPAGLVSAIEASMEGCEVTIVEKRNGYFRSQPIAVWDNSLQMLKKWNISVTEMIVSELDEGNRVGLARIKYLEKHLSKKCDDLGVKRIRGEFLGFAPELSAYIKTAEKEMIIPYDILIAADGFHSKVREMLSIPIEMFTSAKGAYVIIPSFLHTQKKLDFTKVIPYKDCFMRIIRAAGLMTVITMQSAEQTSLEKIRFLLQDQGWNQEVAAIDAGYVSEVVENIPIVVGKAQTFCSPKKSALLIGDAAISLNFLYGDGLNAAFYSMDIFRSFLEEWQKDKVRAFEEFNSSMEELSDKTIERSLGKEAF